MIWYFVSDNQIMTVPNILNLPSSPAPPCPAHLVCVLVTFVKGESGGWWVVKFSWRWYWNSEHIGTVYVFHVYYSHYEANNQASLPARGAGMWQWQPIRGGTLQHLVRCFLKSSISLTEKVVKYIGFLLILIIYSFNTKMWWILFLNDFRYSHATVGLWRCVLGADTSEM